MRALPSSFEAAWLLSGAPGAVLARIVPDDPLGLRRRVAARVGGACLLLDVDDALLALQAVVALRAGTWEGEGDLDAWLEARVDEALGRFAEGAAAAGATPGFARLCEPLGLEGPRLAAACRRFNRLPSETRQAFFALVLEGASPDAFARAQRLGLEALARRARAGLEPFLALAGRATSRGLGAERRA